jgi:hypothetical protein
MRSLLGFVLACVLLIVAGPVRAQRQLLEKSICLSGPVMWLGFGAPGMVLAVVRGRESVIEG